MPCTPAIYGGAPFSACYPGHLQAELRRLLNAPDFISVFGEGCAGDVNHLDVSAAAEQDGSAYSEIVGAKLAQTIHQALPFARPVVSGHLAMRSLTVPAPVKPITAAEYASAQALMNKLDRADTPFLTIVDAWRKVFQHQFWEQYQGKLAEEIQAIRLDDDTALVTLPHEVFVELGMAIKSASSFRTTLVISLANDLDFYVPTRRAFEEGHYEPTTCPLEPGCGELLVSGAVKLLNELKPGGRLR